MSHYKLKATIDGSEVIGESLELNGSRSFKVFPISKNEGQVPLRGVAMVNILGKNYNIQLNHRVKSYPDPETSTTKWSYIENMYTSGSTPVPQADSKSQDTGYIRASRGNTIYGYHPSNPSAPRKTIIISKTYNTYQSLIDSVGDFSDSSVGTVYVKSSPMNLFSFVMFYKYSKEVGGAVIPPTDDDTPTSNKERIPCKPSISVAPDWVRDSSILYKVDYSTSDNLDDTRSFDNWEDFIDFWDSIQTNPYYTDAVFHYIYQCSIDFNELLTQRTGNSLTVSEIDNGKGIGIHGANPLYINLSQQEGKTIYSIASIPAEVSMTDSSGDISFPSLSYYEIFSNKLTKSRDDLYSLKPKFRVDSREGYKAWNLSLFNGGTVIINPEGSGVISYQYIGQPFIIQLFEENANGIVHTKMRPYYKLVGSSTTTEFWRDSVNLMGSQHFNPLKFDHSDGNFNYVVLRTDIGIRTIISGPTSGDHGIIILQLMPICLYKADNTKYNPILTQVNWSSRYLDYKSAINTDDRYNGAFLKYPNSDGNNEPDHIDLTDPIGITTYVGKDWEHDRQFDISFKNISRVMFVPILWTRKRLEDDESFRNFLSTLHLGNYLFSPSITDSSIELNETVGGISIDGLDIQIR